MKILNLFKDLKNSLLILIILSSLIFFSCAPSTRYPKISDQLAKEEAERQKKIAIKEMMKLQKRLYRVSFPILTQNAYFCSKNKTYLFGFLHLSARDKFPKGFKDTYISLYELEDHPKVIFVVPGSPAQKAGMMPGDVIMLLNNKAPYSDFKSFRELLKENKGNPYTFTVKKEGRLIDLKISPVCACNYPVMLIQSDSVNAFTDGKRVYISSGLMRFLQSDNELALVIGHELAHCVMNHISKQMGNTLIGGILGALATVLTGVDMTRVGMEAGRFAFSQEFEAEADYVGCYLAARAGYDVSDAADIWRRIAVFHPEAINLKGSTHPSTAKRFIAIKKAAEEIKEKQRLGKPLIPEKRISEEKETQKDDSEDKF